MGAVVSVTSFDYTHDKPISVMASFDDGGNLRPIYLDYGEGITKVISSIVINDNRNSVEFNCLIVVDNRAVHMMIIFYADNKIWAMPEYI